MPQNLWLLPLKASDGRMRGAARITQNGSHVAVTLNAQAPGGAKIYLLCPDGPVLFTDNTAKINGIFTGIVVMHDGKCILEGRRRGAKVNMEREKMHLRLLAAQQAENGRTTAAGAPPSVSAQRPSDIRPSKTTQAASVKPGVTAERAASADSDPVPATKTAAPITEQSDMPAEREKTASLPTTPAIMPTATPKSVPAAHPAPANTSAARPITPPSSPAAESDATSPAANRPAPPQPPAKAVLPAPPAKSEALESILQQARALFPTPDTAPYPSRLRQSDDVPPRYVKKPPFAAPPTPQPTVKANVESPPSVAVPNPFPNTFPRSTWQRVLRGQGQGWYLKGIWPRGSEQIEITAVPGDYRPIPPRHLQGFSRFIKTCEGGFWLRLRRNVSR